MTDENNVLFVRGGISKSEDEDMWDDTALIQAYDKAVNLAKEEVAKRIAMDAPSRRTKQKSQNAKHSIQTKKPFIRKWTVGAPCRAVYSEDGEVYEAIVSEIYEDSDTCLVEFVGYKNTEKVQLSSLLESEGLQSQIAQQKQALMLHGNEQSEETEEYQNSKCSDNPGQMPFFTKNLPLPPPLPPQLMAKLPDSEGDALSSMLMSWYVSGFHTGYYHGLKQGLINQQKKRKDYKPSL